jgi:uncharacterized protein YihD (DUF1040 family)
MHFDLNSEQKRTILLSLKDSNLNELYTILLKIGIDPEEFDGSTSSLDDDISIYVEKMRIEKLLQALELINSKLIALDAH